MSGFTNKLVFPGDICGDDILPIDAWLGEIPETMLLKVSLGDGGRNLGTGSSHDDPDTLPEKEMVSNQTERTKR